MPASLDVLVSGPLPPDPGEFVGTRKLAEILMELRERYDVVVIDSPPLLRVGDPMTLSSRVDGLLVVARLNVVRRPMLTELTRSLDAAPATKLGYVVTGSTRQTAYTGSYSYGYGYGDAYYSRTDDRSRARAHRGRLEQRPRRGRPRGGDRVSVNETLTPTRSPARRGGSTGSCAHRPRRRSHA